MLAQLVVELALGGLHLTVNRLLALGGKFLRHLLLGPAQNEWPQGLSQQAARVFRGIAPCAACNLENAGCEAFRD